MRERVEERIVDAKALDVRIVVRPTVKTGE